jgi:deoxycytidylate deaminase
LIINAGVKEVVYNVTYRDQSGLDLLDAAGIQFHEFGTQES